MGLAAVDGKQAGGLLARLRNPYRQGQGAMTRRIAYWTGVGFGFWAAFDLWKWLQGMAPLAKPLFPDSFPRIPALGATIGWALPIALVVFGGIWFGVAWLLKEPWLADRLIETEGEMKRVSWPSIDEAWNATKVVSVAVIILTAMLVLFDVGLGALLKLLFNLET